MAEQSIFWTTGTTGDGASTYTDTQLFSWLRRTFNSDMSADRGPLRGYNGELAVTAGTGQVSVATGAAYVYGIPYENDSAVNVAIPTPTSNTRVDRIVLRASWSAKTVRITRIAGTEGAGAPAITQTPGTTYDVKLAQVSITTGGAITVTDERQFCRFATEISTENIADGAVTAAKVAADVATQSELDAVQTSLNSHKTAATLDHPNASVTDAKIASMSASKLAGVVPNANLPQATYSAAASGDLTLTTSLQDVPGCSLNLPAGTYLVIGTFDWSNTNAPDGLSQGYLLVGASPASGTAICSGGTDSRYTTSQSWIVTLASTTTVKLQAQRSGSSWTRQVKNTHTTITAARLLG